MLDNESDFRRVTPRAHSLLPRQYHICELADNARSDSWSYDLRIPVFPNILIL